jgi:hypothetical protein
VCLPPYLLCLCKSAAEDSLGVRSVLPVVAKAWAAAVRLVGGALAA